MKSKRKSTDRNEYKRLRGCWDDERRWLITWWRWRWFHTASCGEEMKRRGEEDDSSNWPVFLWSTHFLSPCSFNRPIICLPVILLVCVNVIMCICIYVFVCIHYDRQACQGEVRYILLHDGQVPPERAPLLHHARPREPWAVEQLWRIHQRCSTANP